MKPQPGMNVLPIPGNDFGPMRSGIGVVNRGLQGARKMPWNVRALVAVEGMTAVPMQCGSHFDRVTQIQQWLHGVNAGELQHVSKNN